MIFPIWFMLLSGTLAVHVSHFAKQEVLTAEKNDASKCSKWPKEKKCIRKGCLWQNQGCVEKPCSTRSRKKCKRSCAWDNQSGICADLECAKIAKSRHCRKVPHCMWSKKKRLCEISSENLADKHTPDAPICGADLAYTGPSCEGSPGCLTPAQVWEIWRSANPESGVECLSVLNIAIGEGCFYVAQDPPSTMCASGNQSGSLSAVGPWQVTPGAFANQIYAADLPPSCEIGNPCCTARIAYRITQDTCDLEPAPSWAGSPIIGAPEFCNAQWTGYNGDYSSFEPGAAGVCA